MQENVENIQFDFRESSKRTEKMLGWNMNFAESPKFPSEEDLQVNKGLYLDCAVLGIRMKSPRKQTVWHHNKLCAFIFSTLVTEPMNLFETNASSYDVPTEHNCIWGIFKTDSPACVNGVFTVAVQTRSLMDMIGTKLDSRKLKGS